MAESFVHSPAFNISGPADNDEIILESRSSELLLRNGISDFGEGQQLVAVKQDPFVLAANMMSPRCRCLASVPGRCWRRLSKDVRPGELAPFFFFL